MTYARLDRGGLQWPCPAEDHPGTPILHVGRFATGPSATLRCVDYRPTSEHTTARYPFLLITGRSLYQFNAGTMTDRTPNHQLRPSDVVDIAPTDAVGMGISDGERVRVESRYGATVLPARLSAAVSPGQVFATFQTKEIFLNLVTGGNRDSVVGTPEFKVTAIRIERVNKA